MMKTSGLAKIAALRDEEFIRQADDLRDRLGAALRIVDQLGAVCETRPSNDPVKEEDVRRMIRLRRARSRFFGKDLFADPVWDILLELYASELGQMKIAITALTQASAVPPTTALRWINALEASGLIIRSADPIDGRRTFVFLSPLGLEAMANYFRLIPKGGAVV